MKKLTKKLTDDEIENLIIKLQMGHLRSKDAYHYYCSALIEEAKEGRKGCINRRDNCLSFHSHDCPWLQKKEATDAEV